MRKGAPSMAIILPTALEITSAMCYLHSCNVLHGDLSPGNILLANSDSAPHGFTAKVRSSRMEEHS